MKAALPVLGFLARHGLFIGLVVLLGWGLWTVAYLVLLLIAVFSNQGLGSPFTYPVGMIAMAATCLFLGGGIFAPASALGAWFCRKFRWPRLAAIPVVFLTALALSFLIYRGLIELGAAQAMPSVGTMVKNFSVYLSLPLGIYWWLTEGPGVLLDTFRRWIRRSRSRHSSGDIVPSND